MTHSRFTTLLALVLAMALVFALPVLGGCKKTEDNGEETPVAEDTGTPPAEETAADDSGVTPPDATDGSAEEPPTNPPATLTVSLYWVEAGENSLGVQRTIPYTQAVATATMKELLGGLNAQEKTTWPALSSAIPAGTKLLGITVANGVAKVDLSKELESGGGTFSVTARLAQVIYTLDQFPTIDSVEFYIEGVKVEMFSSEGLILDGPQKADDDYDLLPIDA
jgi:germination protein M